MIRKIQKRRGSLTKKKKIKKSKFKIEKRKTELTPKKSQKEKGKEE
jgi:hypothetical protein